MEINSLPGMGLSSLGLSGVPAAAQPAPAAAGVALAAEAGARPAVVPATRSDMKQVVDSINSRLQPVVGNIQFSVDQDSGNTLIKIVDKQTQTVLLQIPSQQALEIAKELGKLQGLLIKEKA